ncbi:MAG: Serine/threonine protein kinase PrkC, regulator of stationary phase [Myxococcaceae bacterium]|nr:Serine/threonine protein kinase PrkC, regulator of stationary phase [Myxococcaceae bacterium]
MTPPTLRSGMRFGAYEVVRELGRGAFGTVYEAVRHPLRKRVALKVLNPELVDIPEAVTRFLREAETAAQMRHPYIVDVHDLGTVGDVPYLAMELLDGETLEDRIEREGRLGVETAVDLMLPVISAVGAMHDAGFVHRDLKPSNVFIAQGPHGDHPKLLDFGIVKVQAHDVALTRTASLLGTPSFMSPEQVREARDIDGRADVWSLGVMLYACVTGAVPFSGTSMFETFDHIMHGPIVAPGTRVGGVPAGFDAVVLRAMKREASARIATARELGRALLPYASPAAQRQWQKEFTRGPSLRPSVVSLLRAREPEPTVAEAGRTIAPEFSRVARAVGAMATVVIAVTVALALRGRSPEVQLARAPVVTVLRRPVDPPAAAAPVAPTVDAVAADEPQPSPAPRRRARTAHATERGPMIGNY